MKEHMKNSETPRYQIKRNARKHFRKMVQRSFGLECLEKRTVFANDLSPMLDEVATCFASLVEESRAAPNQNRTVEVSNSPLTLTQGDVIRFEVPETILLQLTSLGTYEFQVYYSENYFSYDSLIPFASGNAANDRTIQSIADQPQFRHLESDQFKADKQVLGQRVLGEQVLGGSGNDVLQGDSSSVERSGLDTHSDGRNLAGQYSTIVLASLTASQDFDGTIRLFDFNSDSFLHSSSSAIAGLPNEVRIEPRITVPTAMRDPGATLVKTIIVNRAATGLLVSEENGSIEATSNDMPATAELPETTSTVSPKEDSSEQKPSRSVVTLKTIDISMVRRNEPARAWMRSSTIANPAIQRESESKQTASDAAVIALATSGKLAAESSKPNRRELRVPGTHLQPVEFLLAKSACDEDSADQMNAERILATDRAISDYSDSDPAENAKKWEAMRLFPATSMQSERSASNWLLAEREGVLDQHAIADSWIEPRANPYLNPIPGSIVLTRESWTNALRNASESAAGQAMLASLTTLAVQHRDINVFGTKTAWEFVTKTNQNSPV